MDERRHDHRDERGPATPGESTPLSRPRWSAPKLVRRSRPEGYVGAFTDSSSLAIGSFS